ncbi:MAG TPA: MBL fold metallo-hydrolase [Kofleriaceae bacterium]|nr:MBL fold metallo-hydrolase [Kofleriaceae bacterium]
MDIRFCGAAREVTGSRHLLTVGGRRVLLDCGLYQGRRAEAWTRNTSFGFDPASLDAVVLSHAHIDHSGALPMLARAGFRGRVHATLATADLLEVMLRDSASIQERDAEDVTRRRGRRGEAPVEPLYRIADAETILAQVVAHAYHTPIEVVPGVRATFYDAGHILGSAVVALELAEEGRSRTLVFSGDLGRRNLPVLRDPETPPHADVLLIESTYGARLHKPVELIDEKLADVVARVTARGGKLIVPAFSVGRTQELCFSLARLLRAGRIPKVAIHVDSPLAVNVSEVFARHPECYDAEVAEVLRTTGDPFGFDLLHYIQTRDESIALNRAPGPFIVISASGMCEAGRVLHHLKNSIEDPKNAVLIVGYQAEHTLGRRLVEGAPEVRIFGEPHPRRAEVIVMNEFSAHADRDELLTWVRGFRRTPSQAFVVHGEEAQALPFAASLTAEGGIAEATVPRLNESSPL